MAVRQYLPVAKNAAKRKHSNKQDIIYRVYARIPCDSFHLFDIIKTEKLLIRGPFNRADKLKDSWYDEVKITELEVGDYREFQVEDVRLIKKYAQCGDNSELRIYSVVGTDEKFQFKIEDYEIPIYSAILYGNELEQLEKMNIGVSRHMTLEEYFKLPISDLIFLHKFTKLINNINLKLTTQQQEIPK